MRFKLYSNVTDIITIFINLFIKLRWWKMVNKLTEFKKRRLSKWFREYLQK